MRAALLNALRHSTCMLVVVLYGLVPAYPLTQCARPTHLSPPSSPRLAPSSRAGLGGGRDAAGAAASRTMRTMGPSLWQNGRRSRRRGGAAAAAAARGQGPLAAVLRPRVWLEAAAAAPSSRFRMRSWPASCSGSSTWRRRQSGATHWRRSSRCACAGAAAPAAAVVEGGRVAVCSFACRRAALQQLTLGSLLPCPARPPPYTQHASHPPTVPPPAGRSGGHAAGHVQL